jgi:malyl-CoA/(S)-citramalyl-CoA lyase
VVEAIRELDWGQRTLSVRVNGLDTPFLYRDVIEIVENAGERLDLLMVPKVGNAADVYAVDVLVSQIETAIGRRRRLGFEALIESASGMQNIAAIATASPRLESLHFGSGDYAASTGMRTTNIGGLHAEYSALTCATEDGSRQRHWNDMWHYPLSRLVVAARAAGLRPIDGPFADFKDVEGFRAAVGRSATLGCEGKWVIHPSQIELANTLFTPSEAEVERARRILAAMDAAAQQGRGAVTLDGRMIDIASVRQAEVIVRKAEAITGRVAAGRTGATEG